MTSQTTSFVTLLSNLATRTNEDFPEKEALRKLGEDYHILKWVVKEYERIVSECEDIAQQGGSRFVHGYTCGMCISEWEDDAQQPWDGSRFRLPRDPEDDRVPLIDPKLVKMLERKFGANFSVTRVYPKDLYDNPCGTCGVCCWRGFVITW